ncbi:putative E3 ubiquitin-protein ligase HERC3 [Phytophthora citrophthora]|uniref:E3 ubiquitin-protein ligase HERC3 n=1 Tax=Phytophthora citrophthora TaxID=4793 RepID=A0AAD9LBG0_9STRA|nr:putative E3 ubiquitin-protein ligase HERC3 [Phytophthora citrophthora]
MHGLYAWGSNIYGQLGLGAHCSPADPHILEPAPVYLPVNATPVLDIVCGDFHSVALSVTGSVFTFGSNREGQLGIDESQPHLATVAATGCAYEPLHVLLPQENEVVYLITAGSQSTAVVATTGEVFQWGKCVPNGSDGARGRISRWLPEDLRALSDYDGASGPVWHSIAIADGLVVATRHAFVSSDETKDPATEQ